VEPVRYGIYMMPPLIGLAAIGATAWRTRPLRVAMLMLSPEWFPRRRAA
jgi:hypothetical protein